MYDTARDRCRNILRVFNPKEKCTDIPIVHKDNLDLPKTKMETLLALISLQPAAAYLLDHKISKTIIGSEY